MIARQIGLCAEFSLLRWLLATPDEAFAGIRALAIGAAEEGVSLNRLVSARLANDART